MDKYIFAICDYQSRFGSKYFDNPYRSGMDKNLLVEAFFRYGFNIQYLNMSDGNIENLLKDQYVLYTSQEDPGYYYKNFIEDRIYSLELAGAKIIPSYKCLRANNNKVMMETLRKLYLPESYQLKSMMLGTYEELIMQIKNITFPCVIKKSEGAGSKGVLLAKNEKELLKKVKKVSRIPFINEEFHDIIRSKIHKGYRKESIYRKKFIIQEFVYGINNDWKVLVFWDKYYILRRKNRPNDFRASGSGLFSFDDNVDIRLLEAAKEIRKYFDVPMISLDLAISNNKVILWEFQFLYFGTSTLEKSPYYYKEKNGNWEQKFEKSVLENIYAYSIASYIESQL